MCGKKDKEEKNHLVSPDYKRDKEDKRAGEDEASKHC